jgi:hypothetical protein
VVPERRRLASVNRPTCDIGAASWQYAREGMLGTVTAVDERVVTTLWPLATRRPVAVKELEINPYMLQ